jgi:hypothetical protein
VWPCMLVACAASDCLLQISDIIGEKLIHFGGRRFRYISIVLLPSPRVYSISLKQNVAYFSTKHILSNKHMDEAVNLMPPLTN